LSDLQTAAVEYAKAGLHILALTGKRPNGRVHGESWSWEDSFYGAPDNEAERDALWQAFSDQVGTTGIAILIPENFYVADVDSERAAELLLELGWLPQDDAVVAKTKNGLHIWFWCPGANKNRWLGDGEQPDPGRTLLFKGFGGYVVAPPSLHFDADGDEDGTYEWVFPLVSGGSLLYMPDVLPESVRVKFEAADQWAGLKAVLPKPEVTSFVVAYEEGKPWWLWPKTWSYGLEGLEKAIINAADGNQNNVIHWAAMTARDEGVPYEVSMTRLLAAAIQGGHPRSRARDTIKGAYKRAPRG